MMLKGFGLCNVGGLVVRYDTTAGDTGLAMDSPTMQTLQAAHMLAGDFAGRQPESDESHDIVTSSSR